MENAPRATLRSRERLRRGSDFRRVFRRGARVDGRLFLLVAARNQVAWARLGLAAGRRLGSATARNRAKRMLRESFRRLKPPGWDLVLVPKPEILSRGQGEVEREYEARIQALESRQARASQPGPDRRD